MHAAEQTLKLGQASRRAGFTLIELMVVITIIGIMAGLIGMNIVSDDPARLAEREARRFIATMTMALDVSAFNQQDLGLHIEEDRYRFMQWRLPPPLENPSSDDQAALLAAQAAANIAAASVKIPQPEPSWQLIDNEPALAEYELPEDIVIEIEIADSELLASEDDETTELTETHLNLDEIGPQIEEAETLEPPQIYILSSGELAPGFRFGFYHREQPEQVFYVVGDEMGRIGFEKDEAEP